MLMLLQTNSYIVPKDKRQEHARLLKRFRQTLLRLGCDHFEAYEQVGAGWTHGETTGRYVQILRFKDRKHQLAVQAAERQDATAQALINEFCEMINFPYQQQQGLFAVGFYTSMLPAAPGRMIAPEEGQKLATLPDDVPSGINTEDELEQAAAEQSASQIPAEESDEQDKSDEDAQAEETTAVETGTEASHSLTGGLTTGQPGDPHTNPDRSADKNAGRPASPLGS